MKTFADALCERTGCPPEDYLQVTLKRCRSRRARLFSRVFPIPPRKADIALLKEAGAATNEAELRDILGQYWYELHLRGGWLARRCKIRVSGQRLLMVFREVMQERTG